MPALNYCAQCGTKLESNSNFCRKCGSGGEGTDVRIVKKSNKSALTALLLCLFFGPLGVHRFYVGKIGTGILMLLTAGGFGIWSLIDLIRIASEDFTDSNGNYLALTKTPLSPFKKTLLIIGLVLSSLLLFVLLIISIAFYATSGITDTVRSQLTALRSGDWVKAYSYNSKDFQRATSFDAFKEFVDHYPALKNNKDSTFTHREIKNNEGLVSGTLKATDGTITAIQYRLIKETGVWKILYIRVNPSGVAIKFNEENNGSSLNEQANKLEKKTSTSSEILLPNVFENKNNKYSIRYPADWVYTEPDKATVVLGVKTSTSSYISTINIQTIWTKKSGGNYSTVKEFMDNMKKQAMQISPDAKIIAEDTINLKKKTNHLATQGKYIIFTYTYKGQFMKQLQFVFLRDDGQVFYAWGYTSPVNKYAIDYPIAKAMFASWHVY